MAKTKKDGASDASTMFSKAIRRAEKLEKTLLKLVAQQEPLSEVERLLKSVQRGLASLRKNASEDATAVAAAKPGKAAKKEPRAQDVVVRRPRRTRTKGSAVPAAEQP